MVKRREGSISQIRKVGDNHATFQAAIEGSIRRVADIVISTILLVLFSPILLIIALIIKIDCPGPAIFKHVRVGRGGKPFTFYKFRTMFPDAKERFPELYDFNYTEEQIKTMPVKLINDPRLTRFGKWLRKTSLDELPNFVNVIIGDMHLVGPRPDHADNVSHYPSHHLIKISVKPGITGLAQIKGRGQLSFLETNDLDVEYVKNRSLLVDLKILLRTVIVTLTGKGAF